nr:hypothetical protein [Candidatus Sigynarchaeota archaeon]
MEKNKHVKNREIRASITFKTAVGMAIILSNFLICCPECLSTDISRNGTRPREHGRVDAFICNNPTCRAKRGKKTGRQFTVLTSGEIKKLVEREIGEIIDALYRQGAKAKTIAAKHGVSNAFVSTLRSAVDKTIARGLKKDRLVPRKTTDNAVSIDETFFKIDGETVYVIIVRGYRSSKVLGINISKSRAEADMRKALDEAQSNSSKRIEIITTDAHEATRAMARHLGYPVSLIVHPHKKPYDKVIIERIEYQGDEQIITQVGVKANMFTKRKKREFHVRQTKKSMNPPAKRPRGRPKGSRNKGTGKKQGKETPKKRGRPSIFEVFKSGKKGYAKIRPRFKQITFVGSVLQPVQKGLVDAFTLFAGKNIQNNHAETENNVIRSVLHLGGQRSMEHLECRIRATERMRSDPKRIPKDVLKHRYNARVYLKRVAGADFMDDYSNCSIELHAKV